MLKKFNNKKLFMLKYRVIKNFISEDECEKLISDARNYLDINSKKILLATIGK